MAIDNNPAIRPPKAGDLDANGLPTAQATSIAGDVATPYINPKQPTDGVGLTPNVPSLDTPYINPKQPVDADDWITPVGDPPPTAPPIAPPEVGSNPFNLPDLTPPTMGSDLPVETPAGGAGGVATDMLQGYAAQGLESPSRYDIPLVQQGIDLINQNLEREQTYGQADLDEVMSSRGLVGSNVEADAHANLLGQLEQSRQQQSFDLARDMATTNAQDRTAAGNLAIQAGQFSEQIAARFQQESQFARSLESDDARAAMNFGLQERAQQLQATGMQMDEAFRYASMEMEENLRSRSLDLTEQGMDEESAYRYAALEQDSRFRSRAQELQQMGMDMDEAYRQAELDLREMEMEENRRMELLSILLSSMSGLDQGEINSLLMDIDPEDRKHEIFYGGGE